MSSVSAAGVEGFAGTMAAATDDFTAWVRPHIGAMANLASRMVGPTDRDDVVQESLTRAWRAGRRTALTAVRRGRGSWRSSPTAVGEPGGDGGPGPGW